MPVSDRWRGPAIDLELSLSGVGFGAIAADRGLAQVANVKPEAFASNLIIRGGQMPSSRESTTTRQSQEWRGAG